MDSSVRLHDALIEGDVTHMSTSQYGQRVVACGSVHAEARVLDLSTNTCLQTLEHTAEVGLTLDDVIMSPRGQYVVTQMAYSDALAPAVGSPRHASACSTVDGRTRSFARGLRGTTPSAIVRWGSA